MSRLLIISLLIFSVVSCSKKDNSKVKKESVKKDVKTKQKFVKKDDVKKSKKDKKTDTNNLDDKKVENNKVDAKKTENNSIDDREKLSKYALSFQDKDLPKDSRWNNYSSGFVKMVYLQYNVDLYNVLPEDKKTEDGKWLGGVELINKFVQTNGELFKDRLPKKGDIIFLDNTFDADKDKEVNDILTSIGIVVDVDKEETVHFLYKGSKGITLKQINLKFKDQGDIKDKNITKTINSKMRWFSKKDKEDSEKNTPELSSQLFNSYGSIFK